MGLLVPRNDDRDEGNLHTDGSPASDAEPHDPDGTGPATAAHRVVAGDDELVPLSLVLSGDAGVSGSFRLTIPAGVKVYRASDRTELMSGTDYPGAAGDTIGLLVEGLTASSGVRDKTLSARFIPAGCTHDHSDSLKVTVFDVDLETQALPEENTPGGSPNELTAGAVVPLNDDDDDANGVADNASSGQPKPIAGENDAIPATVHVWPANLNTGVLTLADASGRLEVWADAGLGTAVGSWTLGSAATPTAAGVPATVYLEGKGLSGAPRDADLRLKLVIGGRQSEDVVKASVVQADVDIDSDNNNGFNAPDRSAAEEQVEDLTANDAHPGKLILVSDADSDGDGLLDWMDGFDLMEEFEPDDASAGSKFTAVVFDVSPGLDLQTAKFELTYDDSDPAAFPLTDLFPFDRPQDGHLRLWKRDGSQARGKEPTTQGGDFVPSGLYTAEELGLTGHTLTLYAEMINPSAATADQAISLKVFPFGVPVSGVPVLEDRVRITSTRIQVLADNQDGSAPLEVFSFITAGLPKPPTAEEPGLAPGSTQAYILNIFDPRAGFTAMTVDGQSVPLNRVGDHYTTGNIALIRHEDQDLVADDAPLIGELEYFADHEYPAETLPGDDEASPAAWTVESSATPPPVSVADGILTVEAAGGDFAYTASLSDPAFWDASKDTAVEVRFEIVSYDPSGSDGADGAFGLTLGDGGQQWEIGVHPQKLVTYPGGVRTETSLPAGVGDGGDLRDGGFHVLRVEKAAGSNTLTLKIDGTGVATSASQTGGFAGLRWGDAGAAHRGDVKYDAVSWQHTGGPGEVLFTDRPSDLVGGKTVVPVDGTAVTLAYNPNEQMPLFDLGQPNEGEKIMAAIVTDTARELRDENWRPAKPSDDGAYGDVFEDRVYDRLRNREDWKTGVLVDKNTKRIIKFGAKSGTGNEVQLDALYLKDGYRPKLGTVLDTSKIDIFEIKANISGDIEPAQLARLKLIKSEIKLARAPLLYDFTAQKFVFNRRVNQVIKVMGLAGLAVSAWAVIHNADADPLLDAFYQKIQLAKSKPPGPDRTLIALEASYALRDYLSAATGGFADPAANLAFVFYVYGSLVYILGEN